MENTKNTPLNWKQVEELPLGFNPTSELPNRSKRRFLDKEPHLGNNRKSSRGRQRQITLSKEGNQKQILHRRKDLTIKLG
jgi:hypothetical protein